MTSKGFASRAARDVLDMLGDSEEDLYFYCIHDADAYETTIYQSLQEATRARPCRRVHIVNLGLEPAEALEMGLQIEDVNRKGDKGAPVASYVDDPWREWLQSHRVELNAMTTPQFLGWLDRKFAPYIGKVVPPAEVLAGRLEQETRRRLREVNLDGRLERAMEGLLPAIQGRAGGLQGVVVKDLAERPVEHWLVPIGRVAEAILQGGDGS
jgi:hypothetical protein